MKTVALLSALTLAAGVALAPAASYAAHAGAPYKNINKKTDKGNDTGDAEVDKLNAAQLNQNYHGQNPTEPGGATMMPGTAMSTPGGAMARPGAMTAPMAPPMTK